MASSLCNLLMMNLQAQTYQLLNDGNYNQIASLYEQAIETEPNVMSHYWYLGLAYLLQNYEEDAQATWMLAIAEGTPEEVEEWTTELVNILDFEAQRQVNISNLKNSWLIRQHIREITPTFVNNLLHLLQLSIDLDELNPEIFENWQLATVINQADSTEIDTDLLLRVIKKIIKFPIPEVLEFVEACLPHQAQNPTALIDTIIPVAIKVAYQARRPDFAANLAQLCLKLEPNHSEALRHLSCFYSNARLHQQAIETAKRFFTNSTNTSWQLQGSYLILRALLTCGAWLEVEPVAQRHKSLVRDLVQNPPQDLEPSEASLLLSSNFFLPYIQDIPKETHWLQNQIGKIFQVSLQAGSSDFVNLPYTNTKETTRPLKIGYITHAFVGHSVGWLGRWLIQYHNKEDFKTNLYLIHQNLEEYEWLRDKVEDIYNFDSNYQEIAKQIKADEIDILIDLDSLTLDTTCKVLALKPAPIQVTWLGWDASGVPAIDYFIADPYVLPENAQDYYSENIWRLPQTYVAVDGFEVDVPTLRREHLEIPPDAVIYYSGQTGYKRNPETVRLQMQIIKQVPNSYFLVKGKADETSVKQFFTQVAEAEGVDPNRLKFIPRDESELVHRANLGVADVVLDTYPYNGATTTLETLWMGVPLVTRVGEQFSARNSYTFMMNVGVTEGIAWTDEEYVEWGVRLGKEPELRQQVAWKLRQSRQTSPLWNAKQFTCEMEKAYKQMWQNYIDNLSQSSEGK
ncbi:O-linked N-acetylglucosamine transferase, SPINDLY family protein [Synechocystis sp. PCC 7509]|uniref:O-linked N-acetylglucosamine transferase, SPINDLY family protein n=1 Tax=Synechocystis sp. PCC 7509 TaxID=927677 RepID=UPI000686BA82|nr:O-linked N-acetylglucosamine transferase, SPINDLY family protein [Synechocystis sp. PCC 7509]